MEPQETPRSRIESLRHIKLFADFDEEECAALEEVVRRRHFDSADVIFEQGAKGDTLIVVIDGMLRVEVTDESGNTASVGRIHAGEVVGEMAVLDPAPRSATVVAATDCEVLELSRGGLLQLRKSAPAASSGIVAGIIADVTRRLRDVNARIDAELNPGRAEPSLQAERIHSGPSDDNFLTRLWKRFKGA